jgi:hypothetical protein
MLRQKFAKAVAVAAVMGATVLTATAVTALPVSAAQQVERPFKAEGSGTNLLTNCGPVDAATPWLISCDQAISQTVIGTHIGRSSRTGTGQIVIDFSDVCGSGDVGAMFESTITTDTLVAANGDKLHGYSVVTGCFVSDTVVTQVTGTWTVDGGTGRFENATGGGTSSAVALGADLSTSWVGTVTY